MNATAVELYVQVFFFAHHNNQCKPKLSLKTFWNFVSFRKIPVSSMSPVRLVVRSLARSSIRKQLLHARSMCVNQCSVFTHLWTFSFFSTINNAVTFQFWLSFLQLRFIAFLTRTSSCSCFLNFFFCLEFRNQFGRTGTTRFFFFILFRRQKRKLTNNSCYSKSFMRM